LGIRPEPSTHQRIFLGHHVSSLIFNIYLIRIILSKIQLKILQK
jgi:hypothetical protein